MSVLKKENLTLDSKIFNTITKITELDKKYNVFEYFNEKFISEQKKELSNQPNSDLEGITFGIKDVYNTKFGYTKRGSKVYANYKPGNNARIVDNIIHNRGLIIGKTKTAEFSIDEPPNTKNFYGNQYHAGTSSTGSAVGCRLGFFDIGLGTQTAGSTFRPASYNGVFGYKPTFGVFPRTGLLKTTDTLDHVTLIGNSIKKIFQTFKSIRVKGSNYPIINEKLITKEFKKKEILFLKGYLWSSFDKYTKDKILGFIDLLKKQHDFIIEEIDLDNKYKKIHNSHSTIYNKSLSYYFNHEYKNNKNLISNLTLSRIEKGRLINKNVFQENLDFQNELINEFSSNIGDKIIISPCTVGEAPPISKIEKDDMCLFFTYLHLPSISIPIIQGPNKLPISIIVSSSKYNDYFVFDFLKKMNELGLVKKYD